EFDDTPGDVTRAMRLAALMQFEITVAARTAADTVGALREKYGNFVEIQIKKHPNVVPLLAAYNNAAIQSIQEVMSSDPDEAQKRLDAWKEFLDARDTSTAPMKNLVQNALRTVTAYEGSLAANRKRLELVGKAAIPLV